MILVDLWGGLIALVIAIPMVTWDFARYDHPFWAFFISLFLTNFYSGND